MCQSYLTISIDVAGGKIKIGSRIFSIHLAGTKLSLGRNTTGNTLMLTPLSIKGTSCRRAGPKRRIARDGRTVVGYFI
jgi:hypothetical protein